MKSRSVNEWMQERAVNLSQLMERSGLEKRVVAAIVEGRYTPSPQQREKIAVALSVDQAEVAWGHVNEVSHVYGHGPQFGRTP